MKHMAVSRSERSEIRALPVADKQPDHHGHENDADVDERCQSQHAEPQIVGGNAGEERQIAIENDHCCERTAADEHEGNNRLLHGEGDKERRETEKEDEIALVRCFFKSALWRLRLASSA